MAKGFLVSSQTQQSAMASWLGFRRGSREGQAADIDGSQSSQSATATLPPPPPSGSSRAPLLGHTLSFHDAAHDDVRAALAAASSADGTAATTARLNIIARNVALVTSYTDAQSVLAQTWPDEGSSEAVPLSRVSAYRQLMASFYTPPNLLLEDEDESGAQQHRNVWDSILQNAVHEPKVHDANGAIVKAWLTSTASSTGSSSSTSVDDSHDLYDICKDLGHRFALGVFLGLRDADEEETSRDSTDFAQAKNWGDTMLRGQFSLPVGVNVGLFRNAFSRGQAAKREYDALVNSQVRKRKACPFTTQLEGTGLSDASISSHMAMFSSSLVAKAFASLLTALLLQLYRRSSDTARDETLAESLARCGQRDPSEAMNRLDAIITETERISPPIIGVMRRVQVTPGLTLTGSQSVRAVGIPCGWDVWPYFPLANRDDSVFQQADIFNAERYLAHPTPPPPLSFGAGVKSCLGYDMVRLWLRTTAAAAIGLRGERSCAISMTFDEEGLDAGVRSWLGWEESDRSTSWRSVKQLPTQRPRKPIMVHMK